MGAVPIAAPARRGYIPSMNGYIVALLIVSLVLVFGTLATGLISFARGGENAPKRSNTFMRYRVLFQGVAVLLVVILMALAKD
jgi:hypothetical protein